MRGRRRPRTSFFGAGIGGSGRTIADGFAGRLRPRGLRLKERPLRVERPFQEKPFFPSYRLCNLPAEAVMVVVVAIVIPASVVIAVVPVAMIPIAVIRGVVVITDAHIVPAARYPVAA